MGQLCGQCYTSEMTDQQPYNPSDMGDFTRRWAASQDLVRLYVESVVWRMHDAEDVVQQVAYQAGRNFRQYDADRPFGAWVMGIARNEVRMYLRKHSRDRLVFSDEVLDLVAQTTQRHADELSPRAVALRECMKLVPESGRALLRMRYTEDMKGPELSARLGISQNAVLLRLSRLRKALAQCIEKRLSSREGESS